MPQYKNDINVINYNVMQGNWAQKFDAKNTKEGDFMVTPEKKVKVQYMYQQEKFKYGWSKELDAKVSRNIFLFTIYIL